MPPCNGARGEVTAMLAGCPVRLCLTLGALAEMETAFDAEGLSALAKRLRQLSAADLVVVLQALARGGGEAFDPAQQPVDLREAAEAVTLAFTAAAS